jgi:hypothetical protein
MHITPLISHPFSMKQPTWSPSGDFIVVTEYTGTAINSPINASNHVIVLQVRLLSVCLSQICLSDRSRHFHHELVCGFDVHHELVCGFDVHHELVCGFDVHHELVCGFDVHHELVCGFDVHHELVCGFDVHHELVCGFDVHHECFDDGLPMGNMHHGHMCML